MLSVSEKVCIAISGLDTGAPHKAQALFELFDSAEEIWFNLNSLGDGARKILGAANFESLQTLLCDKHIDRVLAACVENDIVPVTYFSEHYPQTLREMYDPPLVLYCRGKIGLLESDCVAVIGTRKADAYGRRAAKHFVPALAQSFTIVSGLAYGIDTEAHENTLEAGGKTIAVIGSGINRIYPASNTGLANSIIASGGLIVSEYEIDTAPSQFRFPMRNRIISGLSRALLVIQAPVKSGVFSTIDYALEQGKDVFVVPGEIFNYNCAGSNSILKRIQAALVTGPEDIFSALNAKYTVSAPKRRQKVQLDIFEEQVASLIKERGRLHFDEIAVKSKIELGELNYILASLELKSIIARLAGNTYQYSNEES